MDAPVTIRLKIAYDGTPFSGWQSQPDRKAVQDIIEKALHRITGTTVRIHGSGRTDAGVHALAQVAHFLPPPKPSLSPSDWTRALNAHLPPTVRIISSGVAPEGFHSRFSAVGKTYRYLIHHAHVLPPLLNNRTWHLHGPLDDTLLSDAISKFLGTHDFRGFAANRRDGSDSGPKIRTISSATVERNGPDLELTFRGDGFLYKMVRILTGTAVHVARGRSPASVIDDHLSNPLGQKSKHCAPAHGLYLVSVTYPTDTDLSQTGASIG